MNSTSVSTSCATERCTSSGSAFHRHGEDEAPLRSSSRRRSSSRATSRIVSPPRFATSRGRARFLVARFPRRSGFLVAERRNEDFPAPLSFLAMSPLVGEGVRRPRSAHGQPQAVALGRAFDNLAVAASRAPCDQVMNRHNARFLLNPLVLDQPRHDRSNLRNLRNSAPLTRGLQPPPQILRTLSRLVLDSDSRTTRSATPTREQRVT